MTTNAAVEVQELLLDDESLKVEELSISTLQLEISLKKRPNWLLFKMMNALEAKRQKKGLGWSRAWNKYGVNVFRSHTCDVAEDHEYLAPVAPFLTQFLGGLPTQYRDFVDNLFNDPKRMAFTFYHNYQDKEGEYEGLTLSFGRKVPNDKTKRDRLDIVLEDRRCDGSVDGLVDRAKVYVCPWASYQERDFFLEEDSSLDGPRREAAQTLYATAVRFYHEWKEDESRQWNHWSTRFIEYFGPRTFIPKGSSFT